METWQAGAVIALHIVADDNGVGTPLVMTHGWVDDLSVWDAVRTELSDRPTAAWDLRGHGRSEAPPPGNYTRSDALGDLARVVDRYDGPVHLVGHSLGGYLSLAYTLLHPERVAGLGLVAAGPGFKSDKSREQWNRAVRASAGKLDIAEGSEALSLHDDSWVIDELSSITQPVVVVVGERDTRFIPAMEVFADRLHVVHSEIIPDAGHRVHVQQPAATAAALRHLPA